MAVEVVVVVEPGTRLELGLGSHGSGYHSVGYGRVASRSLFSLIKKQIRRLVVIKIEY